ncbi:hypothetical protein BDY24DRAFT_377811 [Mrakia frigida]|uniref:uncharacterized protein n=1 Tax=Mrakia frigida TaxID=29902 RepID=UPI003FCC04A0
MYGDRSRTFVTISWGNGVSASSPRIEQIQTDPPRRRTMEELEEASACYGERIARWCEGKEGTQVGRGECWDLADQAIKEVGRELKEETGGEHEGLAEAIEHAFGEVVYVNLEGKIGWGLERKVRRGDVLQFVYATFKTMYSDGSSTTSSAGTPETGHTAVVIEEWTGVGGAPIKVLQSNVGGSPLTRQGQFNLGDLVSGEVRVFRVMDEEWGGGPARPTL